MVGMGSAATVVKMSHLSRNRVVIKCHQGVASWWADSQLPVKSPQKSSTTLSDVCWPAWLCPGRRFCLSPQLIIVACDQGQPAYETMQPLQVALDDIDDNEPIFLRPPVRHRGGGGGTQGFQGWGCQ